jgi:NADH:ubiquinone oxidoreductase subunit 6 (subunit J)
LLEGDVSAVLLLIGAVMLLFAASFALAEEHRARIRRRQNYERLLAEELERARKRT